MTNSNTKIAYAWYKPEQWHQLRAVSIDRDRLEDTFEEWATMAEASLANIHKASGLNTFKIIIDVNELVAWCKKEGKVIDGAARSELAAIKLKELDDRRT